VDENERHRCAGWLSPRSARGRWLAVAALGVGGLGLAGGESGMRHQLSPMVWQRVDVGG